MREITDLKEIQQMAFHILTALSAVLIFYHCYLCFIIIEFCLSGRQEGFLYCVFGKYRFIKYSAQIGIC